MVQTFCVYQRVSGTKTPQLLTKLTLKRSTVKFTYLVSRSTHILPVIATSFQAGDGSSELQLTR